MANPTISTIYSGEALDELLTKMVTGNEIVQKGLVHVQNNIQKKFALPRVKSGKRLQARKPTLTAADAKGGFDIDERYLEPNDAMVFDMFNPREFESFWRPFQPQGALVYRELPAQVQQALIDVMTDQLDTELNDAIINGDTVSAVEELAQFNGLIKRLTEDGDTIVIPTPEVITVGNVASKLDLCYKAAPEAVRRKSNCKFIVSTNTMDLYEESEYAKQFKGANSTDNVPARYRGKTMVDVVDFPDDCILFCIADNTRSSNLWLGVDFADDDETIQIDKLSPADEQYFFKMLMKMDTNVVFPEEAVLYKV